MSAAKNTIKIAITGNPNSGKTTLFNIITGLNQKTGNYPGVTVDKKESLLISSGYNYSFNITDLPGTYNLSPQSEDEKIACDILINQASKEYPDVLIFVADSNNLKVSLFFLSELIERGHKILLVLSMWNEFKAQGNKLDIEKLSELLNIEIITFSNKNRHIKRDVLNKIPLIYEAKPQPVEQKIDGILKRYEWADEILKKCSYKLHQHKVPLLIQKIDYLTTHPIYGIFIFLFVLVSIFQSVFVLSNYPMQWIENMFIVLNQYILNTFPDVFLTHFLTGGLISGLSGIFQFIPQIVILFFLIQMLEESGYMPRVGFLLDKLMKKMGLSGRSVIPIVSGYACAVPAMMATRSIPNQRERILSMFAIPFMTCSARLPVYTLIISIIFSDRLLFGVFSLQALVLTGMYLLGLFTTLASAFALSKFLPSNETDLFMMEIPYYKKPRFLSIFYSVVDKVKIFLKEAGKVILITSLILWFLSYIAPKSAYQKDSVNGENVALEETYLGLTGKFIEPAITPLGYNWKIGISIITSFAAREVFVGTMSTIYGLEDENPTTIREKMSADIDPKTNAPVYSFATGISLLLFYAFALQCISTVAIMKRETKGWKWPIIQFAFMLLLAYSSALVAYQILS